MPIVAIQYISPERDNLIQVTYIIVAVFSEVVVISLAVSDFIKAGKDFDYLREKKIKEDRDLDIAKWRKEFVQDSLSLYEMQKESLKRAKNLTEPENSEGNTANGDSRAERRDFTQGSDWSDSES